MGESESGFSFAFGSQPLAIKVPKKFYLPLSSNQKIKRQTN